MSDKTVVTGVAGLPAITLKPLNPKESKSFRRAEAVVAALEVIRASYLSGKFVPPVDACGAVGSMADAIQKALELKSGEA